MTAAATAGYSLENATRFGWNSLDGDLLPERAELLRKYVVGKTVLDAGCGGGGFVDELDQAPANQCAESCSRDFE